MIAKMSMKLASKGEAYTIAAAPIDPIGLVVVTAIHWHCGHGHILFARWPGHEDLLKLLKGNWQ